MIAKIPVQNREAVLKSVKIIGCTTNGAARYAGLLRSAAPKVLIVEEAGQILEARVLAALSASIEVMISIGDPLQLRPSISSYSLSMDSKLGRLHALDKSMLERLSGEAAIPMQQLLLQRRMRPEISNLIRMTIYPNLQDHPAVLEHPKLKGFNLPSSLFFFSHKHAERLDEQASKSNTYEVNPIHRSV